VGACIRVGAVFTSSGPRFVSDTRTCIRHGRGSFGTGRNMPEQPSKPRRSPALFAALF
jgi:hypothetical protein